jgi:hypothetical protein
METDYRLRFGFDSRPEQEIFLYSTASTPPLGSTQVPIQWVLGAPSEGVKRLVLEANLSPPSSVDIKNDGIISLRPQKENYF